MKAPISIIIPTYNRLTELKRCINSIVKQRNGIRHNIIVVDDGSTDGTKKYLRHLATKNLNISFISQQNHGPAAARNSGIKSSASEYVMFIDDDCELSEGFMEELKRILKTGVNVIHANCMEPYKDNYYNKLWQMNYRHHIDSSRLIGKGVREVHILGNCYIVKRDVFDKIGLFDESLITKEDTDMVLKMYRHGIRIMHYDDLKINHYSRAGALRTLKKFFWYGVGQYRFDKKHPIIPKPLRHKQVAKRRIYLESEKSGLSMRRLRACLTVMDIGFKSGRAYANMVDGNIFKAVGVSANAIFDMMRNIILLILNR